MLGYLLIEMWRRKQAWFDLPTEKQEAVMQAALRQVSVWQDHGVELLHMADLRWNSRWETIAIWHIPRIEFLEIFADASHSQAWNPYFEHTSMVGSPTTLDTYAPESPATEDA